MHIKSIKSSKQKIPFICLIESGEITEEEGGELDSHEEVRLDCRLRGQARSRGRRWCWTFNCSLKTAASIFETDP